MTKDSVVTGVAEIGPDPEPRGLAPETTRFPAMSARALFFSDPEGNLLEFICYDDGRDEEAQRP